MTSVAANPAAQQQRTWTDSLKAAGIAGGVAFAANAVPMTAIAVLQQAPSRSISIQVAKSAFHALPMAFAAGLVDFTTHKELESGTTPKHLLLQDAAIGSAAAVGGSILLKNNGLVPFEKGNSRLASAAILGALAGGLMYEFEPKKAEAGA